MVEVSPMVIMGGVFVALVAILAVVLLAGGGKSKVPVEDARVSASVSSSSSAAAASAAGKKKRSKTKSKSKGKSDGTRILNPECSTVK
jgi:hypothetical protein